jgi:hypothetical protein
MLSDASTLAATSSHVSAAALVSVSLLSALLSVSLLSALQARNDGTSIYGELTLTLDQSTLN